MGPYQVIVVGGGHAGIEAALASARLGLRTLLISMDRKTIGRMSCNPAIGGIAKGQLVREIDALGGEMGLAADDTAIQFKMLNRSKGPAVWSPRAQCDRAAYASRMRQAVEEQRSLEILEGVVTELLVRNKRVVGVRLKTGQEIPSETVILTAGTFLNGVIHIGLKTIPAGRIGEQPAIGITESLVKLGFVVGRLKTGTPPRLDGRSIDFEHFDIQPGDPEPVPFSFRHHQLFVDQLVCYITRTNPQTHDTLREGFDESPLFTGRIKGVGPRYCPSVEDKVARFPHKNSHLLFLEPEGRDTEEYYINGFSTSLPEEIQYRALRTIPGLENVVLTRPGYAVEYDFFPPSQLKLSFETKLIENLFFAGQINGTSGYEEAAAQGLMAGINAALKVGGCDPFILDRSQAYVGVLIDDLVTKDTLEPYRMFTSRAEYRLRLRQDNADLRLMDYGWKFGLIPLGVYRTFQRKRDLIAKTLEAVKSIRLSPERVNPVLARVGSAPTGQFETLAQLLRRPGVTLRDLSSIDGLSLPVDREDVLWRQVIEQVEIEVKYEGFMRRQEEQIERFQRFEEREIQEDFDYTNVPSLSTEGRQKLMRIRPRTLGMASRISGVTPADVSILMIYLAKNGGSKAVSRETEEALPGT